MLLTFPLLSPCEMTEGQLIFRRQLRELWLLLTFPLLPPCEMTEGQLKFRRQLRELLLRVTTDINIKYMWAMILGGDCTQRISKGPAEVR